MAQFYAAVMTNDGAALLAEAIAGNANIQFTTMVAGDGEYAEDERAVTALQAMTSLKNQKQSVGFSSLVVESETSVHLTGILDNEELTEGYYVRELGIYAKNAFDDEAEPVLYSIAVAQAADYMPPYNGLMPTTIIQEYFATVDNSANVTLIVRTGVYVLAEDFEDHKNDNAIHITDSERSKWNGISEELKNYSDAIYQQSTGYTDQKIADLINGAPSTLDTLGEIAKAMSENKNVVEALDEAIGNKASQAEMESLLKLKLDKTGDAKDNTVTFTSDDTTAPSGWTNFDLFKSGETFKSLFGKISTMAKNLRWLYKMLGTTDISKVGDGTVTGAIDSLNSNIPFINFDYITVKSPVTTTYGGTIGGYGVTIDMSSYFDDNTLAIVPIGCVSTANANKGGTLSLISTTSKYYLINAAEKEAYNCIFFKISRNA